MWLHAHDETRLADASLPTAGLPRFSGGPSCATSAVPCPHGGRMMLSHAPVAQGNCACNPQSRPPRPTCARARAAAALLKTNLAFCARRGADVTAHAVDSSTLARMSKRAATVARTAAGAARTAAGATDQPVPSATDHGRDESKRRRNGGPAHSKGEGPVRGVPAGRNCFTQGIGNADENRRTSALG